MRHHRAFYYANLINNNSRINVAVINAATTEKYVIPNKRGHKESITAKTRKFLIIFMLLPVKKNTNTNIKIIHEISAVKSGEKFAYPNGTRLK